MNINTKENEQQNFEHDNLTEQEKEEAKQNGFILVGRTGVGKTTILNAIFNKRMCKSSWKEINTISIYYYKLTNGKVVSLVDTPGFEYIEKTDKNNTDNIHLERITKVISEAKIHIKGILFLINFQNERLDYSEEETLLNYNTVFPLKNFWKSLVLVYTHFYSDPNEYEDEDEGEVEMKESRSASNGKILELLMEKVKGVSDTISYKDLKIKYCNSYSEPKNNKKISYNNKTREQLESVFDELSKNPTLYNQVEIKHITNHKWTEENGIEYIGEVEMIYYFDLNKEPIKQRMNIIKKDKVIQEQDYPPSHCEHYVYNASRSSSGYINYQRQEANKNNSRILSSCTSFSSNTSLGEAADIGLDVGALFRFSK